MRASVKVPRENMRLTLASESRRRRASSAYVRPRARTLFFSASTKRLTAGMRLTVSDNATLQASVAARHAASQELTPNLFSGGEDARHELYPVVRSRAERCDARGASLRSRPSRPGIAR